jgi:hypothetical protein
MKMLRCKIKKLSSPYAIAGQSALRTRAMVMLALKAINALVLPFSGILLNLKTYKSLRLSEQHDAVFLGDVVKARF